MIALLAWALAIAAAVCAASSLATLGLARIARPFASRVHPRTRARVWLLVALLPAFLTALVLVAVLAPPSWFGLADHCASHGDHHLHLCARHGAPWPPLLATVLAALFAARVLGLFVQHAVDTTRAWRAVRRLWGSVTVQAHQHSAFQAAFSGSAPASECRGAYSTYVTMPSADVSPDQSRLGSRRSPAPERLRGSGSDVLRLPLPGRIALTAGWLAPRVYATAAVVDDPSWSAVLAHERDHARHRDPLAKLVARFALALHAPGAASWIESQLVAAQELAADEAAASSLCDRLEVARQLVAWARELHRAAAALPLGASSFEHGDVEGRVRTLMDTPRYLRAPLGALAVLAALAVAMVAVLFAPHVHHGVESLLGTLGA